MTITSSGGVPQPPSANLLRAQTVTAYDEQGRVYQTVQYDVNQSTGSVSSPTTGSSPGAETEYPTL